MNAIIRRPIPQVDVSVRAATLADIPFIDSLQKVHRNQIGFMPTGTLEGKINAGDVLIAEDGAHNPIGYCIGTDRYFKHDDVGIIYHLNVAPGRQRGFVGATLLKAMFDRAAYGCKLFCCWCAQDIEANRFWASMGFVPLAYRAGSEKKSRVHIFWQKRIRAGDTTTPWWFPAKTDAGAMREDRLVLPIPPGLRWSDELPVLRNQEQPALTEQTTTTTTTKTARLMHVSAAKNGPQKPTKPPRAGVHFRPPGAKPVAVVEPEKIEEKPATPKVKRLKKKADPKLIAAARELRDRWLEHVNAGEMLIAEAGKYDVARALTDESAIRNPKSAIPLLPAA